MPVLFVRMVEFKLLAQFLVDHLPHSVISSLILFLCKLTAFFYGFFFKLLNWFKPLAFFSLSEGYNEKERKMSGLMALAVNVTSYAEDFFYSFICFLAQISKFSHI